MKTVFETESYLLLLLEYVDVTSLEKLACVNKFLNYLIIEKCDHIWRRNYFSLNNIDQSLSPSISNYRHYSRSFHKFLSSVNPFGIQESTTVDAISPTPRAGLISAIFSIPNVANKILLQFGGATTKFRFLNSFSACGIKICSNNENQNKLTMTIAEFGIPISIAVENHSTGIIARWLHAGVMTNNNFFYITGGQFAQPYHAGQDKSFLVIYYIPPPTRPNSQQLSTSNENKCKPPNEVTLRCRALDDQCIRKLPKLAGHSMVYDETNHRLIVFGGLTTDNASSNVLHYLELPRFDANTTVYDVDDCQYDWIPVADGGQGNVPSPRYCHSAQIVKRQMVVFGGWLYPGTTVYNDIHILDLDTFHWRLIEVHGGVPPSPRCQSVGFHIRNKFYNDTPGAMAAAATSSNKNNMSSSLEGDFFVIYGGACQQPELAIVPGEPYGNIVVDFDDFHIFDLYHQIWLDIPQRLKHFPRGRGGVNAIVEYPFTPSVSDVQDTVVLKDENDIDRLYTPRIQDDRNNTTVAETSQINKEKVYILIGGMHSDPDAVMPTFRNDIILFSVEL